MTIITNLHRSPSLAELKVSYKRREKNPASPIINSEMRCESYLRSVWQAETIELREEVLLVCLNTALGVLGWVRVAEGGMSTATIDPRIIFGVALATASSGIILAHNHPSGNVDPSEEDDRVTRELAKAGKLLNIRFVDHMILTRHSSYSYAGSTDLCG
jgi:DNA repair protein RadC